MEALSVSYDEGTDESLVGGLVMVEDCPECSASGTDEHIETDGFILGVFEGDHVFHFGGGQEEGVLFAQGVQACFEVGGSFDLINRQRRSVLVNRVRGSSMGNCC